MSRDWTTVTTPDPGTGEFRVRVAPAFHGGAGLTLATPCATEAEARGFARRVDHFLDRMLDDLRDCAADGLVRGGSPWTHVYLGDGFYVRLLPGHMDTEAAGYPHGLAVAGRFPTRDGAKAHALAVDAEMEEMLRSLRATLAPGDPLLDAIGMLVADADTAPTGPRR